MANQTVTVLEADGITETDIEVLGVGRQGAAASKSVAASTEDKAVLDAMAASLETIDGRVDGLETLIASTNSKLDTCITALQIIDNMVLQPGAHVVGKVGIDLTTPGTTNKVSIGTDGTVELGATSLAALETINVASVSAGENHLGEVGGRTVDFPLTLSLDTSAYAADDLLADTQQCDGFFRKVDGTGTIRSLQVIDQDDQKAAIDFYFLIANVSLGTENSAPNISDANAVNVRGPFRVLVSDYIDLGGVSVAHIALDLPIKAVSGTDDLYVAAVIKSAATYTASGIKLAIGGLLD